MRLGHGLLVFSALLLAGCGGSHSAGGEPADPQAVIRAVMSSPEGMKVGLDGLFPKQAKSVSCVIHGGGPGFTIAGTCASRVEPASDGSAVASFVETWDGHAFHGPGSAAKPGLSHTWEFHVDSSRHVTSSRSFGDFPPQRVK
jgi:hypothetical protein